MRDSLEFKLLRVSTNPAYCSVDSGGGYKFTLTTLIMVKLSVITKCHSYTEKQKSANVSLL